MTTSELIEEIAEKNGKISKKEVHEVIDTALLLMWNALLTGDYVKLRHLGTLYPRANKRTSAFGNQIKRERIIKFRQSKRCKI